MPVLALTAWKALSAWTPGARQQSIEVLDWIRANLLSAAAIGAAAAVAGVLTPFLIRWLDRRRPRQDAGQALDAQQRAVMLRRVRYKWITGVLEPSLARAAQLVLGLERRPDFLDLGTRAVRRSDRRLEPLPDGTPVSKVLDDVGGGLLILGAPGAGKTTALLQLCKELLDRAEQDPEQSIPIVVNLATWARERPSLERWLVDELVSSYQVPRRIATDWVDRDALALLLDGLDEVAEAHRAACVETLNAWRHDHGLVPVVVCSRTDEAQALGPRLRLEEAIELQPVSETEVDRYLGYLELTGTPVGDLRAVLAKDRELQELLRTPLLLHVVALAYHGRPATALYAAGTQQQRQAWLWEAYVARMFEQRPLDAGSGYTDMQARHWLTWLARALRDRDESEFHLDRLAPEWLTTPAQQQRGHLITWLAAGLIFGLGFGPAFGLVANAFGLAFGLVSGLVFALVGGLALGLVGGLVFGLASGLAVSNKSLEQAHWSLSKTRMQLVRGLTSRSDSQRTAPTEAQGVEQSAQHAQSAAAFALAAGLAAALSGGLAAGLVAGLVFGLTVALAVGLAFGQYYGLASGQSIKVEPTEQVRWSWPEFRGGLIRGLSFGAVFGLVYGLLVGLLVDLVVGLVFGLASGLTIGLVGGLLAGLSAGLRDERAVPNEGIRRSGQHALIVGMAAGLASALIGGLSVGLVRGQAAALAVALGLGLAVGPTVAMVFGGTACLQHCVVRTWLVRERHIPWQYGAFLDAMAHRLLLRRSGGAYLFIHRLLRDYLADQA